MALIHLEQEVLEVMELNKNRGEEMGKKEAKTLDQRIDDLKKQQEQAREFFIRLQGAIEYVEQMKDEDNEKAD